MANHSSDIKKNFAYQAIYEILILILPFVTSPYIARVIGANGLGIYSYSYSVAYYFVLVSMLGLKNYGNRTIAKARDDPGALNRAFSSLAALHIAVSAVCALAYIAYAVTRSEDGLYAWIQFPYVISALFDISWFYFGIERFRLTVLRNTVVKIASMVCIFAFVKCGDDLWKYCLILSLGQLISQLLLWVPLRKYVRFIKPELRDVMGHMKPLLILFVPAIAVSLYKYMDKIMIGSMSSKVQLGFYENAEKVVGLPLTIIASFGTVMLPKMSNLASSRDRARSGRYIDLSMQFVMCLAYALAFGLAGIGDVFAPVFWGGAFAPCGLLIMGLSITIPFISFADVIRTQYLIPNERDREYLLSVICGAAVNLIVNFFLIPSKGAVGAMIGTIAAEMAVCGIQAYSIRKELPLPCYIGRTAAFLGIGLMMFVGVYGIGAVCGRHVWTLACQVFFGAAFYGIAASVCFYRMKNAVFLDILRRLRGRFGIESGGGSED